MFDDDNDNFDDENYNYKISVVIKQKVENIKVMDNNGDLKTGFLKY